MIKIKLNAMANDSEKIVSLENLRTFLDKLKEAFIPSTDIINNLNGGIDKALSAEMGKVLNEKMNKLGSGLESIKFKGYANVNITNINKATNEITYTCDKSQIDSIYDSLQIGEACLVTPSTRVSMEGVEEEDEEELKEFGVHEDSYLSWISSAVGAGGGIANALLPMSIGEELLKTDITNILKGEVRTYFVLDKDNPYWQCPDMLLLAKIKVKIKPLIKSNVISVPEAVEIALNLLPDDTEITACVGKILRWSAGDWLAKNIDNFASALKHSYEPYNTHPDYAIETGIIAYTLNGGPISGERFTVIVNASSDKDASGNSTIQQIAYGRTGTAVGRVWIRIGFSGTWHNWIEISNNLNILPNVNGWLLPPDNCLSTGVYQTCDASTVSGLSNNYCTLFVKSSTTPNADGWNAIEQTAYGREADTGKIYKRVIFRKSDGSETQYGDWVEASNPIIVCDSEDELDSNAKLGSLAVVVGGGQSLENSFISNPDNPSVNVPYFNIPSNPSQDILKPLENHYILFGSSDLDMSKIDEVTNPYALFAVLPYDEIGTLTMYCLIKDPINDVEKEYYFLPNMDSDNEYMTQYNEALNELNQLTNLDEFILCGLVDLSAFENGTPEQIPLLEPTQEQYNVLNKLFLSSSVDLYLKNNSGWEKMVTSQELANRKLSYSTEEISFTAPEWIKSFEELYVPKFTIQAQNGEPVENLHQLIENVLYYDFCLWGASTRMDQELQELKGAKDLVQKKVTYSELKSLRDNSQLVPGQKYRITDYVCSSTGQNMSVMNHPFDIIVEALAENKLSENAKAAQRSNDIGSLINSKLFEYTDINGWKSLEVVPGIPQQLLNIATLSTEGKIAYDRTKHSGLNPGNVIKVTFTGFVNDYNNTSVQKPIAGLGVVLANQDDTEILAYDYGYNKEAYYITMPDNVTSNTSYYIKFYADGSNTDAINGICGTKAEVYSGTPYFINNDLSKWDLKYSLDRDGFTWASLYAGVFKGAIYYMKDDFNNEAPYDFKNILFPVTINGSSNYYYTFSYVNNGSVYDATVVTDKCFENKIKGTYNIDGTQSLNKIVFINEDFGSDKNCSFNSFDGYCNNMVFGHACCSNTFGCYCTNNSFGRECSFNKFGDYFGLNGGGNSFGNYCQSNTFGVNCDKNTFGDYILRITFGNKCTSCKFTNAELNGSLLGACKCITVGDECNNLNLYNTEGPSYSSGKFLQNIEVNPGLTGNVKISGLNKWYKQVVTKTSNGRTTTYIDGENSYELPPATEWALGGVMIGDGFISSDSGYLSLKRAGKASDIIDNSIGGIVVGTGFEYNASTGLLNLGTADSNNIGGIVLGTTSTSAFTATERPLKINSTKGTYVDVGYASKSKAGIVQIGDGLTVSSTGLLSANVKATEVTNSQTRAYTSYDGMVTENSLIVPDSGYVIANNTSNKNIIIDAAELNNYSSSGCYKEFKILWEGTNGVNLKIGTLGLARLFTDSREAVADDLIENNIRFADPSVYDSSTNIATINIQSPLEIIIKSYGQTAKSRNTYQNLIGNEGIDSSGYVVGTGLRHKHYISWHAL